LDEQPNIDGNDDEKQKERRSFFEHIFHRSRRNIGVNSERLKSYFFSLHNSQVFSLNSTHIAVLL
jgi:hypothetical protein